LLDHGKPDRPLKVGIENNQLVIRIGIDRLAYSAENCERFYDYNFHEGPPYIKITNNEEFANDVIRQLVKEAEDGSTPLDGLLDDACVDAYEDGSTGIKYPKRRGVNRG
jgi:hypothetical protein